MACPDCSSAAGSELDTDWHPDPDGDDVPLSLIVCPTIYDVAQGDADDDGVGDFCDADFAPLKQGGPIVDLRAQHVTPYGGWFGFTSPKTTRYGQDYVIAWSAKESDVATASAVRALGADSKQGLRAFEYAGSPLPRPQIISAMEPTAKYYVSVVPLDDYDKPTEPVSNLAIITTAAAPALSVPSTSPRVLATPTQLARLRERSKSGDASFATWSNVMGDSVLDAARSGSKHDFGECLSAALLFHGTGRKAYRDAALSLVESMRAYWDGNKLEKNQLRWADANLGLCADLMWQELSNAQRSAIVKAFLDDDEGADLSRNVDTDEFASITRTWIVDGLVGCNAQGVDAALSERACTLLDRGLRAFYGVQLVKARRSRGFFAQSGGNLPDGIGYAFGTATYWLKTLIALGNVGGDTKEYAPWVWNNLQAMQIQSLTPKKRGFATFGDLDSYDNFGVEPNSHPVLNYNGGLIAMHMGLLEKAGRLEQAQHARWHLDSLFPKDDFGGTWAMLLFAHDGLSQRPDTAGLPTAFFDKSMGMLFDRTSWQENASFLSFRAGWSGADHSHEDAGSFQLYRDGTWLTNEALGYDGPAASAEGHNVPALEIAFDNGQRRVGQFRLDPTAPPRILRRVSTPTYSYIATDLTGAYTSGRHHSFSYKNVERHILWLKPGSENSSDRIVSYDRVVRSATGTGARVGWQMHINSAAEIRGSTATFSSGSNVDITLVHPQDSTLRYQAPAGVHSQYPGERYTSRLTVESDQSSPVVHHLAVMRATLAPSSQAPRAIESNEAIGAIVDSDIIIFPRDAAGFPSSDLLVSIPSKAGSTVYWGGLTPKSSYGLTVTPSPEGTELRLTVGGALKTDAAGVLIGPIGR